MSFDFMLMAEPEEMVMFLFDFMLIVPSLPFTLIDIGFYGYFLGVALLFIAQVNGIAAAGAYGLNIVLAVF
jgi:hypothetical protein